MNPSLFGVVLVGCGASITLNLGKGIQKMKVHVLKAGLQVLAPEHRKDFSIWCVGITLTIIASILFMQATKMAENPSLVSSLTGVGLIAMAIFSMLVLKEKVGVREWFAVAMIITGTAMVQAFVTQPKGVMTWSRPALIWSCAIAGATFVVLVIVALKTNRGKAFFFSAIAGSCLGIMLVFYKIGTIEGGEKLIDSFKTAYPYIGMMIGNGAFAMTQWAFFHGTGIVVVPTVNSFMIVIPMVLEVFILGVSLIFWQYVGAGVIVLGVIVLSTGGVVAEPADSECDPALSTEHES